MVFKVVDNNLTTVFNKVQSVSNGFDLASSNIENFVDGFNRLNSQQNFGSRWESFLDGASSLNSNVSLYFQELAEKGASARASVEGVYAAILDGNTKGFANVKSTMTLFNQAQQSGADNAQDFAKAVSQSNTQLGGYLSTLGIEGTATLKGYTGYLVSATAKTIGLQLATVALNAVINFGLMIAITGLIKLVDYLVVTLDESREALANLKDEYSDLQSDITSVNDELKTTIDRMNELENKKSLTFTEKEEYDNLVATNNELERKLALLELEEKRKQQEINSSFVKVMKKDVANLGEYSQGNAAVTEKEYINQQFDLRQKHYQTLIDIEEQYKNAKSESEKKILAKDKEYYQKLIDNIDEYLLSKNKLWTTDSENISYIKNPSTDDEKAVNEWLDYINDFQDRMTIAMGGTNAKTNAFNRLVDNWQFDDVVQGLQDLGEKGQVTAKMLDNPKYDEFIQKLVDIGVIDSADNIDDIALAFNGFNVSLSDTSKKADDTASSIYTLVSADEELKDSLDDIFENQSTIQSAFDKIQKGSSLSADEVRKLIELYPQLASEFTKTSDGYTIDAEKLIKANDDMTKDTVKSLQERANYLEDFLSVEYDTKNINSAPEAERYNKWRESVASAKTELEELNLILSMFGLILKTDTSSLEEMEKKLEEYSKSVSSFTKAQDTISDAYDEQAKHGQLASDTISSLIDAGYSRALSIDAETGAVTLNSVAVERLNAQKQKELEFDMLKDKNDLEQKYKDEAQAVADLQREMATANEERREAIRLEIAEKSQDMADYYEQMARIDAMIANVNNPISFDDSSKKKSDDPWKEQFENEYNEKQHLLALNQISEEDYIDWLDDAYKQYFSDLTKYQDEYWKYEEEVYKWRTEQEQKLFDKKIDNYEKLADKALEDNVDADGNKLELSLSFDYAREQLTNAITELQQRINDIRSGVISGTEDDIEQLKEDIDSLNDKLKDIDDKEVTAERDFLKDKKDEYSDFYDEQIDKLKEQQDEIEKLADQEKEAIQAKIDLLEEANSKKSEEIDLEKKRQELEKAKSQRTIARLNADGTTSYVADAEKINDAQEEYDNAKYEYQKSLLEAQIEAIEKAAKEQSEKYDDQIKLVEEQKKMSEEKFDALIKPLDDFLDGDKQTASNTNVWDMISKISGSTYENGVWSDKDGNAIDINNLVAGIDDLTEQEKENSKQNSEASQYKTSSSDTYELLAKYFQNKGMTGVTAELLEKGMKNFANNGLAFKNSVPSLLDNTAVKSVIYNNSRHTENVSYSINGDIVIQNPVSGAEDLGKEILKNGATIFNQQTHTNRK